MATISEALAIAVQHHQAGRLEMADEIYRRILAVEPDQPDALHQLGLIAQQAGNHELAAEYMERAIRLKGTEAAFHDSLGEAYRALGRASLAVLCFRRALELQPDSVEAHCCLGAVLQDLGALDEAIACYRRALELQPEIAEVHNNLGVALKDHGKLDEAVACYRRALELKPDYPEAHNNLLCALQYQDGVTLAELFEAHQSFERRHTAPLRNDWRLHTNTRDPDGRLRLGFLSPDFRRHPVGYFLISVLERLDRQQCETICYNDRIRRDDVTDRFQAAASTLRDVYGLTDDQLAEQIRADQIDILFDLAGHTAENRLLVFARKPAPIQITWIGYEGTTGLSAMDYIIADRRVIPEGSEPYYRERVLRMPDGYVCLDPPTGAPEAGPLPAADNGHVTFGSFNNLAKIGPQVVEAWAEILRRAPQSRLVIQYHGLGDEAVQRTYLDRFAALGIARDRLSLLPPSSYAEYMAGYNRVDIAVDPFPFSGSATTCDALWMGVPVITWPGETFASRHGLTHLTNVGLTETIARGRGEYVELAVSLASELERLAEMRARLREQMARSPLCDGNRFAANLTVLLRDVWRKWVSGA